MVFEYKLKKNSKLGITAMSIVDTPAVLVNFITLSKEDKQDKKLKLSVDEEQHIVSGPALIPDLKIFRNAESLGTEEDGYIYFSAETIKEMSELFMTNENMNNITLDHEIPNQGLKLIESWIILDADNDKSNTLGFDLPKGSWMVTYKVTDDELWNNIKAKEFNGFSIEAYDFDREVKMSKEDNMTLEAIYDTLGQIIDDNVKKMS